MPAELSDSGMIGVYEYPVGVRPIYGIVRMDTVTDTNIFCPVLISDKY